MLKYKGKIIAFCLRNIKRQFGVSSFNYFLSASLIKRFVKCEYKGERTELSFSKIQLPCLCSGLGNLIVSICTSNKFVISPKLNFYINLRIKVYQIKLNRLF